MLEIKEIPPEGIKHDPNLFQSPFWARFKENQGYETQVFRIDYQGRRVPLILIHRPCAAGNDFGYVPHGPDIAVPADQQGPFLEAVARRIRGKLPQTCRFLRFDLPWSTPYIKKSPGGRRDYDPPEPRVREIRMNFGCRDWNLYKAPTDMQPLATVLLDTRRPAAELLRAMHPKTRYSIRAAQHRGVAVVRQGIEALPRWHQLYSEMTNRKAIESLDLAYFQKLFATARRFQPQVRLYLAHHACRPDTPVAGAVIAFHNDTAYYLHSAASPAGRKTMASYAVLWQAIVDAKRHDCVSFDLMGIPPVTDPQHPMHGLYRFKTRFGGKVAHFRGCWDYPFEYERYNTLAYTAAVSNPFHIS